MRRTPAAVVCSAAAGFGMLLSVAVAPAVGAVAASSSSGGLASSSSSLLLSSSGGPAPSSLSSSSGGPSSSSSSSSSGGPAPATARAQRTELLVRIAELTDRVENTQADVVGAQLEQARLEEEASSVRARVRARAVAAYIHGHDSPDKLAAPTVYLQVRARKERDLLARYRTATNAVLARRGQAEAVQRDLRAAGVDLDSARRQLDALVAADDARLLALQQAAEQRAAADARRRAVSATASAAAEALARARNGAGDSGGTADLSGLLPRHKEATRKQAELMQRYPFGVLAPGPLPGGLRSTGQAFSGAASWYGGDFNGRPTASGAIYDMDGWTAASRTLPLGTMVVVSRAGVRVLLLVNDRGPYVDGRVLDLSAAAARALNVGVSDVDVEVVQPAG